MKHHYYFLLLLFLFQTGLSQQISIPRIELMSNLPENYQLKEWKKTALDYYSFIFDIHKTGEHLPLVNINPDSGTNYPEINQIRMDTYVGQQNHGQVAEAINIIPAIVGASLLGRNKTEYLDINWVTKINDFFNKRNGQNVYLNNYSANSGGDWWYETMPNIFFYQLYSLYPQIDTYFEEQFTTVADRWLEVVFKLGGNLYPWYYPNMNYRAFNLITGEPRVGGVPEPEAAGAIAWILYQAYKKTNKIEYRYGAELALDFLQNETRNPSYEIQLPYGILSAAQMNAVEGTNFDIDKMLNWAFSSGIGTLRGWGCIVGNWNGYDMSGLIGEANDNGNDYAFSMNGFQHAAALVPVVKYDKKYARSIAKWILNLSNASRFFYCSGLPPENQESNSYQWSSQYDDYDCIPYESIRENRNGIKPFAMGDAVTGGWAATNLSLYSGSSIGYLASLIEPVNVEGILQIDLNITDFRGNNSYPTFLFYNPHSTPHDITLNVGTEMVDIYDCITETIIKTAVTGDVSFLIDDDNVFMPVIIPSGIELETDGRLLKVKDGEIIDFHYGYDYENKLRIKVFTSEKEEILHAESVNLYCLTENGAETLNYAWYVNGLLTHQNSAGVFEWKAPEIDGEYLFSCIVNDNETFVHSQEITIRVMDPKFAKPEIKKIDLSENDPYDISTQISISVETNNVNLSSIEWSSTGGRIENGNTLSPLWILPEKEGVFEISLNIGNDSGNDYKTEKVLVKDFNSNADHLPLIYYPFNGDTKNHSQDFFHAISVGANPTSDARGYENNAFNFTSPDKYIFVPNEISLNFNEKIALSLWLKPDYLPNKESFVISHGSGEERYALSIISSKNLSWTVKTNQITLQICDPQPLEIGKFFHYTAQYTGYSLELYRNGQLVAYNKQDGNIAESFKNITFARQNEQETNFHFLGTIDEVRIYDTNLSPQEIEKLPHTWSLKRNEINKLLIYPNPAQHFFYIQVPDDKSIHKIEIFNFIGQSVWKKEEMNLGTFYYVHNVLNRGLYIIKVTTIDGKIYHSRVKIV